MSFVDGLKQWFRKRTTDPLAELLCITWDDERVLVTAAPPAEEQWNQEFRWANITRVCFKDAGLWYSDILFISVRGREQPHIVLTEAEGGHAFFGQLVGRKFFPEELVARSIRSTSGELICWPVDDREGSAAEPSQ